MKHAIMTRTARPGIAYPILNNAKGGPILIAWLKRGALCACIAAGLAGCIQVEAPDKPIVIELNITIDQQVVYRLARDAEETIEDNPGIF
jgi:hypothetical protein